jgi:hypothetical protein
MRLDYGREHFESEENFSDAFHDLALTDVFSRPRKIFLWVIKNSTGKFFNGLSVIFLLQLYLTRQKYKQQANDG